VSKFPIVSSITLDAQFRLTSIFWSSQIMTHLMTRSDKEGMKRRRISMNSRFRIVIAVAAGVVVGGAVVQGLHAQAKPKAYIVTESQIVDASAAATYGPRNQAAQKAAGGTSFRTTGKITAVVGTSPERVGLSEWSNVDAAQSWLASQGRKDLSAERDKAIKIMRQYIVEAAN
jgi:uncharacterized protein (DUF1330 family)